MRVEDAAGNRILERDPSLDLIVINVIDKLLVTQVTSRPLTLEEIEEKGIVIDEDNFTAMNFTVGLTLGSEQVVVELPVMIPNNNVGVATLPGMSGGLSYEPARFQSVSIPNLSIVGFSLGRPPELEGVKLDIPRINGVIVIPGNIAFLNQFFSVILQATNVAPDGSGLVLQDAKAVIALPLGDDELKGSGDDPLRVAETQTGGVQEELALVDGEGVDVIVPQGTNAAEFLVEGLREGTHTVTFDISGNLFVPSLGRTVAMKGRAAGVVGVKNPTFSLTLAHPDVVREGEKYSLFATVTNTSTSPANLFQLRLKSSSLSGARLVDGESDLRTLETLAPGQAETFEYRLVATTTGKVTGTVFLADPGINGSFVLRTGVGDAGIPLSPDSLVLPQTVDHLPDDPDLVLAAVRLLGQAYSVATAPAGALPENISRMSKSFVFERAVTLAQEGLHVRFGEGGVEMAQDLVLDYFGSDLSRLEDLYPAPEAQAVVEDDLRAFDGLRRTTEAGRHLSEVLGAILGSGLQGMSLMELQAAWAERAASRPVHLSFGVSSRGPPPLVQIGDAEGRTLGRIAVADEEAHDLPFADVLPLTDTDRLLFLASPVSSAYTLEFSSPEQPTQIDLSLVLPGADGMVHAVYPTASVASGGYGRLVWDASSPGYAFEVDTTGDGVLDTTLAPLAVTPVQDRPPAIVGVHQWAKGNRPLYTIEFANGDPLGRMVGVLFDEAVDPETAEDATFYRVPEHRVAEARLQPDKRLVFLMLREPVGPFIPREL
ncbi:MAG: hypothetical protein P1P84_13375, partial [Deferrisomatales bacterium]|nr:hypothetical protein [Deferrisomatales bacterium]